MGSFWNRIKRALARPFERKQRRTGREWPANATTTADRRRRNIEGQIVALDQEIADLKHKIARDRGSGEEADTFDLRHRLIRARDFRYKAGLLQAELERSFPQSELLAPENPEALDAEEPPTSVLEAVEIARGGDGFGDPAKREIFERVARDLLGPSLIKRRAAVTALGSLGAPGCAPVLRASMAFEDGAIQAECLTALLDLQDSAVVGDLEIFLESANHRIRLVALRALYNRKSPAVTAACLKCLADTHAEVRRTAAVFLGLLGARETAQALATLLRDESVEVRVAAAKSLEALGAEQSVYMLIRALEDEEVAVRAAAKSALVRTLSVPIELDVNQEPRSIFPQIEALMSWWTEVRPLGQPWRIPVLLKYGKPHFAGE